MHRVRRALLAVALTALSAVPVSAITLEQLLVPGTEVTVGCLKFSNFGNFSVVGFGSASSTTGFSPTGSDLDLQFIQTGPSAYEVQYSGFDITNIGPGIVSRTLSYTYDVEMLPLCFGYITQVDASGIFGGNCSPPGADPPTNRVDATFSNTFVPDAGIGPITMNLIGFKENLPPSCLFQDMVPQLAEIGPASKIQVVKEFNMQLLITEGDPQTLFNAHVSAYRQSFHLVPEPGSALLLLVGGVVGSLFVVRRRRA